MCAFGLMSQSIQANPSNNKGKEIAQIVYDSEKGYQGELGEIEMILINAQDEKITRKLTNKILEMKDDGPRFIIEFLWPADVKGTKLLTWSHRTKADSQWIFMPAFNRTKRISSRNKSGAFMGSEFSYEDLASTEVEKYTYRYIKDTLLNNRESWLIERYPVDKNSGYSKHVCWVDKEYKVFKKVEYYDRKSERLKTAIFKNHTQLHGAWYPNTIHITNSQTRKQTIMNWKKRTIKMTFKLPTFSPSKLNEWL